MLPRYRQTRLDRLHDRNESHALRIKKRTDPRNVQRRPARTMMSMIIAEAVQAIPIAAAAAQTDSRQVSRFWKQFVFVYE